MATKTITIMEDAYEMLKKAKAPGESFSDLFRREFSRKKSMMDFAGSWSDEIANEVKGYIAERRKENRNRKILEI